MDCQEFAKKRGSSSSSSGSEDEGIVGNDQPTRVKIVQRNDGGSMGSRENNTGGVVIIYSTEETKQQSLHNNDIRSESQKSSGLSSQSRPSIYDEVQRGDIYHSQNDGRHPEQNRPLRNNQINIPYFDSQKYHQQNYRNNYPRRNQGYSNNYPRENTHYRGQRRFYNNNDRLKNDYYHQCERNYQREKRYEERDQRQNFRNYKNQRNQKQPYQRQNYYNETSNYQRNNHREQQNDRQQKQQSSHKYENNHQKLPQKKVSKTSVPKGKAQKSKQNSQRIQKKSSINNIISQKPDQKVNNLKEEQPKVIKKQQEKQKIQQKVQIPTQKLLKVQQKPPSRLQIQDKVTKGNKKIQIKKENVDLSSDQSELNKGHSNIDYQESSKSKDNTTENFQQNKSSSGWDNSSNDSEEENQKNDKSSFECQQLSLQLPLPPLIPDNRHNLSDLNEDLSFLQELGVESQKAPQKMQQQQKISESRSNVLAKRNSNDSFNKNEGKQFSEQQLKILRRMFDDLPADQQSVFIELKVVTSNVASFKVKNVSSEVFNLKDALTKEITNHPFIKIKQFQKSVPRDFLPLLNKTSNNEISDSKISKLVLAQILYPLHLLEHREKFVEKSQKVILEKIEKKKKIFEDVDELIAIDYINLRCSSCHNKKSFFWNNSFMPHQCNSNCPNILRFSIESIYIC